MALRWRSLGSIWARMPVYRDPLVDLMRRRIWAGWIDVLILAIVGVLLSLASSTPAHWRPGRGHNGGPDLASLS